MKQYIPNGFLVKLAAINHDLVNICDDIYYCPDFSTLQNLKKSSVLRSFKSYAEHLSDIPTAILRFSPVYAYLGDIEVGTDFQFELNVNSHSDVVFSCPSQLPQGIHLTKNKLHGSVTHPLGLVSIDIVARTSTEVLEKTFFINFYEGRAHRRSFVHNDYIDLGYGPKYLDYDPYGVFNREIKVHPPSFANPTTEAANAARLIFEKSGGQDLLLFVSGGIDSQCMIQAFEWAQVPYRAIIMKDINGVNAADISACTKFLKAIGRLNKLEILETDFVKFISNYEYLKTAFKYRHNNPEYGLLLSLMDQYSGFYVFAGRPIALNQSECGHKVLGLAGDETWSKARYMEREQKSGCSEFLSYTPELLYSFMNSPFMATFNPLTSRWYYRHKLEMLKQSGFETRYAPPHKMTGFEKLRDFFNEGEFANEIWTKHRFPLKLFFPNPPFRKVQQVENGAIIQSDSELLKTNADGFSWRYLQKEKIEDFH